MARICWKTAEFRRVLAGLLVLLAFSRAQADESKNAEIGSMESEIEDFCTKRDISDRAVRIALAQLWHGAAATRSDTTVSGRYPNKKAPKHSPNSPHLQPQKPGEPLPGRSLDTAVHITAGDADLYWIAWCGRLQDADLRIVVSTSGPSALELALYDSGAPGWSRESTTSAFIAGNNDAWRLVQKAISEARVVEAKPENAAMSRRAFSRSLPHFQAILLLQHMIRTDNRLGIWKQSAMETDKTSP